MNIKFSMPKVGCKISITFAFHSYILGKEGVSETTITGIVENATKFTPPNFIRLVTDFDSPVRIREIPLHRITNLEYADGSTVVNKEAEKYNTKTWVVEGSKGSQYTVIYSHNIWNCTCPGFQFRKNCRHITELKDA